MHTHLSLKTKPVKLTILLMFLVSICVLLTVSYVLGIWTIEVVYNTGFASLQYPSIIIKGRLPSFITKGNGDNGFRKLLKLLADIQVDDVTKMARPSCVDIIAWNRTALKLALIYQQTKPNRRISDFQFPALTADCSSFISKRRYITEPVTREEEEFPLAFSILIYDDVEQFERLLRAIYRPQNYYCIHVDLKSRQAVHDGARSVARCFQNVFIASRLVNVNWGTYSVLEAELICMADLWKYKQWKYFINLTGKEFPLQTNLDIVKILKIFNGANNIEGTVRRMERNRIMYVHNTTAHTKIRKGSPPVAVTLTKGSVHITASRAFVDYVLHDDRALKFREWVKDTGVPDETFFSSLNHSPQLGVPGSYKGTPETDPNTYPFFTRFKNWGSKPFDYPCYGIHIRRICIYSVGDLKLLSERAELFANKFHLSFQPIAYECMEELIDNRTIEEKRGTRGFDSTLYENFEFVYNHV